MRCRHWDEHEQQRNVCARRHRDVYARCHRAGEPKVEQGSALLAGREPGKATESTPSTGGATRSFTASSARPRAEQRARQMDTAGELPAAEEDAGSPSSAVRPHQQRACS